MWPAGAQDQSTANADTMRVNAAGRACTLRSGRTPDAGLSARASGPRLGDGRYSSDYGRGVEPMILPRAWLAALVVLTACSNGTRRDVTPDARAGPSSATIMLDTSWWLQVRRDGDHSLGYGALPVRVPVAADGVDAPSLLDTVARRAYLAEGHSSPTTAACGYTVTLHGTGSPEGLVHALPADLCGMLADAFRSAWAARAPPRVPMSSDFVERAWANAPFQRR